MNYRFLLGLGLTLLVGSGIVSCSEQRAGNAPEGSMVSPSPEVSPSVTSSVSPSASPATPSTGATTKATANTMPVTVYTADRQCNLVPTQVTVLANQPVDGAIAEILKSPNTDFRVTKHKVKVQNGVATVDLQPDPNSARRFESLSSCEQTAIFESIQRTLTANAQWKIHEVTFTEKGKELEL
jgi:hypothetical protein